MTVVYLVKKSKVVIVKDAIKLEVNLSFEAPAELIFQTSIQTRKSRINVQTLNYYGMQN